MMRARYSGRLFAIGLAVLGIVEPARACYVCFGDPNSGMVKGAVAGVLVLFGIIGTVLTGIAGTGLFWIHRSRKLARLDQAETAA